MNDVVVDRGPSPYLTNLEIFCNGRKMTSVQGDGTYLFKLPHRNSTVVTVCQICPSRRDPDIM